MGKPTGFLEYKRETARVLPPKVRIANFNEFRTPLSKEKQKTQGARCMACGVPFCQSGMMLNGMASGCPLHNLVPETNDLVYTGNWKQAYLRLSKTHSFPEFTPECVRLFVRRHVPVIWTVSRYLQKKMKEQSLKLRGRKDG